MGRHRQVGHQFSSEDIPRMTPSLNVTAMLFLVVSNVGRGEADAMGWAHIEVPRLG